MIHNHHSPSIIHHNPQASCHRETWQHATKGPGNKFMLTPADTDALHRLRPMLAAAVSKATSEDEHAVSEVTPWVQGWHEATDQITHLKIVPCNVDAPTSEIFSKILEIFGGSSTSQWNKGCGEKISGSKPLFTPF